MLDIDKHGGRDGELTVHHYGWALSGAAIVETMSGGMHAHFKANGRTLKRLCGLNSPLPSIDLLADGGWCALPTPGSPYRFVNGADLSTCSELPDEIASRWAPLSKRERELRGDCDRLAVTAEGGRRTLLNELAFKYGLAVIAGKVQEHHWRDWLTIAAVHCGLPAEESAKTIDDAWHDAQEKAQPAAKTTKTAQTDLSSDFEAVAPWPLPVNGDTLAQELCAAIRTHVVLDEARLVGVAFWIIGTYFVPVATHAPRLAITSPRMRCGKTTLLRVIGELVPRPVNGENLSPAVLYRLAELVQPVFLLDEVDQQLAPSAQDRSALLSIINSGHERSGRVWRMSGEGAAMVPVGYRVFASMALAGIGRFGSDALRDRCITIPLERRLPGEETQRFDYEHRDRLHEVRSKLQRFADDSMNVVMHAAAIIPATLNDRQQDNWRLALRIAEVIGGAWPDRARQAAVLLSTHADKDGDDDDLGVMLLGDCHAIYGATEAKPDDWVKTGVLVNLLMKIEEHGWDDAQHPLTDRKLARLLKPFGIRSADHDFSPGSRTGRDIRKGYQWRQFADVWRRYLRVPP
ncbi:hypothetical protein GGD55_003552 [Rhizobium giardinii]|uniref:DUF3631 domain-containing protein n=1 Tax=Rhizobium giardinii TaxID=56731 RepID=A0A7W8X9N3_9HYPH|nr:hypothetical protein [Rhizobium giardinii]